MLQITCAAYSSWVDVCPKVIRCTLGSREPGAMAASAANLLRLARAEEE